MKNGPQLAFSSRATQLDELAEALRRFTHAARDTRFWHEAKAEWMRQHPGSEPDHSAIAQLADRLRACQAEAG